MNWISHYMIGANWVKAKSKDPHTQVGCIIVGPDNEIRTTGYNGLPRGVHDSIVSHPERHERTKEKYSWYAHAEENAIANAARVGIPLKGCTAFITALPCPACSRMIVGAGLSEVYWAMDPSFVSTPERAVTFEKMFATSKTMLSEAGIALRKLSSTLDNVWCVDSTSHSASSG